MRTIKVMQGQSLFDVAIMWLGSALGAVLVAGANDLSLTAELSPGQELVIPTDLLNKSTVNDFRKNGINPATAVRIEKDIHYAVSEYVVENYWV